MSTDIKFLEYSPAVVIDQISMVYKTTSRKLDLVKTSETKNSRTGRLRRPTATVEVAALKNLSLVVEHGESLGIIGRNGSGKSTLLKIICGQIPPTSGVVYASATPIMLGVNAALLPALSGDQNIILGCLAMGMSHAEIDEKYESIVELSGLEEALHMPMKSYSSGMSSRLRFAIAASIDPEILIIDEALNTGDAQFKDRTLKRMHELLDRAGTVFLVSHSLSTVMELCSRVVWLDDGELLFDGNPADAAKFYRQFTQKLSAGDRIGALKLRRRLLHDLEVAGVVDRNAKRRNGALE
ncbi:ABC transporter ATP-binding protein [Arthrobacter sp. TMP15]|uniref:ABC transporter ATP-binding protein n=1 Tax=Arthrobacter sp. TMP15 TaxID=3140789 RepID=UPI0031BB8B64